MSNERFQDTAFRHLCSEKTLQSNSQGFFLNFADYVVNEVGNKSIKNVFGKLKSDSERIRSVYLSKEVSMSNYFLLDVDLILSIVVNSYFMRILN